MITIITRDGRRIPFLDWASVCNLQPTAALQQRTAADEKDLEEGFPVRFFAPIDLLDHDLLALIQG